MGHPVAEAGAALCFWGVDAGAGPHYISQCQERREIPPRLWKLKELAMAWTAPVVTEVCVGMEVTSYESAEI